MANQKIEAEVLEAQGTTFSPAQLKAIRIVVLSALRSLRNNRFVNFLRKKIHK
jgi:hypothetical protein